MISHWNSADLLPPVGCPLLLDLGPEYDHDIALAERLSHLVSRERDMEYQLSTGQVITGRFRWTYP